MDLTVDTDEDKSEIEESIFCDSEDDDVFETAQEDAPNDILSKFKKMQLEPASALNKTHPEPVSSNVDQQFKTLKLRTFTPDTELSESDGDLDSNIFKSRSPGKTPLKTYRSPRKIVIDSDSSDSDKENNSLTGEKMLVNCRLVKKPLANPLLTMCSSYPKLERPDLKPTVSRPLTPPPASPRKSKLVSPSKNKAPRIPTPPHRQSLDAFWDIHAVNDWNDQYSPQKPLVSPKKDRFRPVEDTSDSPISSPRKLQSPSKKSRAVIDAKKDFENRKHQLAEDFLTELDRTITEGKVQELASGGVKFIWSKTLNSTAGRANWRREKMRMSDGTTDITYRHHASIELAEKVIDDEERLLNVVAHEFCHLANFMVSGIKDQPHGRQFKIWGAKCTKAFAHRGVEVTTKHSYQIDYKYIWSCSNELCGQEFKRHSKSIDPTKQTCGVCRGKIVQVKPVPRKQAGASGPVGYAAFVKQNFAGLKKDMVGASHKEVMTALGQRYRDQKAAALDASAASAKAAGVDDLTKALEVIELD